MRYKKFGNTDIDLSVIALGTWVLGGSEFGEVPEKDAIASIHAMLDNGVNVVDTAPSYALGNSEVIIGKALKDRRDKVFLISKCGIYWPPGPKDYTKKRTFIRDSSRERLFIQIDETLQRLQTDYLDAYLIHWPDVDTPVAETVDALNELKKIGKIRYSGMSNFEPPMVDELFKLGGMQIAQYPFSMINMTKLDDLKRFSKQGVFTMGYAGLGAGILTGTVRSIPEFAPGDARGGFYDHYKEPKFSKIMELLKTLDKIAEERNVPVAQVTVNWNISHDFLSTSLTGVRSPEEAAENCAAGKWELTAEEIKMIDDAIENTIGTL